MKSLLAGLSAGQHHAEDRI